MGTKRLSTALFPLLFVIYLCVMFVILLYDKDLSDSIRWPLVAILGVSTFLAILTVMAMIFNVLNMHDAKEALGLPSGVNTSGYST